LQIIKAVSALHQKQIAHMDIKPDNILITKEGTLKLCDFSFSMPSSNFVNRKMGSGAYMAPELHGASTIPCRAQLTDVFSLGVLFFVLAFGAPPFQSADESEGYFFFLKARPGNKQFF